jgi:hypothetical protein
MRGPLSPLLILLLATSITNCAGGGLRGADLSASEEDAVRATVYRYQMAHDAQPGTEVFCLCSPSGGHEYGDPSSALLVRFDDEPHPAVTCSACQVEEGRIVERASGKTAVTLYIADVRPLPSGEVQVEGGSRWGKLFSTRMRYRVVREGGDWKVVDVLGLQTPVR